MYCSSTDHSTANPVSWLSPATESRRREEPEEFPGRIKEGEGVIILEFPGKIMGGGAK